MDQYILSLETIDTHTMGEATRIVVNGFPDIVGETMMEKKEYVKENYDHLRKLLMNEPRGHKDMFGSILTEPCNEKCDIGIIFMDSGSYLNMCGHGTIGTVTMCLTKGIIPKKELIYVDTPSGVIECRAYFKGDQVESIEFTNVPAFILHKGLSIKLNDIGDVSVDIAFGGSFFGIINSSDIGVNIDLSDKQRILELATEARDYINEHIHIEHPTIPNIRTVDLIEITNKISDNHYKNVVVFGDGQIDRSPCGTGTCAKMAALELEPGASIIQESIIGSTFEGKVLGKTKIAEIDAIIPAIKGSAWITGEHRFILQEADIYAEGFAI
ncbi:proline racemase family protein [Psychrobacillus sp. BL-248-WT-3]|uniref:proline racemase family protein n=1 Tax=Psychrobacillus sp. BL-248-WT-3 TaxID=2725306 RepID=UPI00146B318B|nr:proline racemase family protein [Psychrobacillus sp. BL-248-WT-3]NME07849.1 proline racemase [Psychrobacillus sp. BL-248-WT-3]